MHNYGIFSKLSYLLWFLFHSTVREPCIEAVSRSVSRVTFQILVSFNVLSLCVWVSRKIGGIDSYPDQKRKE